MLMSTKELATKAYVRLQLFEGKSTVELPATLVRLAPSRIPALDMKEGFVLIAHAVTMHGIEVIGIATGMEAFYKLCRLNDF